MTPLIYSYAKAALNDFASTRLPEVDLVANPNSIHYEIKNEELIPLPNEMVHDSEIDPLPFHISHNRHGLYGLWYLLIIRPGEMHKERSFAICNDECTGTLVIVHNPREPWNRSLSMMTIDWQFSNNTTENLHRIGPDYNRRFFNPNPDDPDAVGVEDNTHAHHH
ncbi:hypothetical protein FB446DRAFT_717754 [Lentinula raphanica]|nr:hypothetical protein FB446DRAFT_717754 [Lentinula raphanica]